MFVLAVIPVGLALAGDRAAVEAEEYSAYSDPEKPVVSYILSQEQNVEDLRKEFGLTDAEVEEVLAAVREENETLSREYAESERIVESNEELPEDRIRSKVAASDYDEKIKTAVAATKSSVKALMPKDRRVEFEAWVDEQWRQEVQEADTATTTGLRASATGITCRVFATQYRGYTRNEVAVPHRRIKFDGGYRVRLRLYRSSPRRETWAPVKEVGPWNTYDNYWNRSRYRTMWKSLSRCTPEAQAAYFHNYHNGRDEYGRKVLNPAGVDLTPAVAHRLGLRTYENRWLYVYFPWAR